MLLGFISLLLTVFQGMIQRTCIPEHWTFHMLPCEKPDEKSGEAATTEHFVAVGTLGRIGRRLLSEGAAGAHCQKKVIRLLELEFWCPLQLFLFLFDPWWSVR
jgi:mlo protein